MSSPYLFHKREGGKTPPTQYHDKIENNHYDIAFNITWKTVTPTALNSCEDPNVKSCCNPVNPESADNNEYSGYNKRWLTMNNRLAFSPFTVKSAIANGFANIMGGCYRVNTKLEEHKKEIKEGHYPYGGKYKRYRVDRAMSKPGILKEIEPDEGGYRVLIQPVEEFYYDQNDNSTFNENKRYSFEYDVVNRRKIIKAKPKPLINKNYKNVEQAQNTGDSEGGKKGIKSFAALKQILNPSETKESNDGDKEGYGYYGSYRFGMDLSLNGGQFGKNHFHRFYKEKKGDLVSGLIPAINFETKAELKEKVYMGQFSKLEEGPPDPRPDEGPHESLWYETLRTLKKGDWVYYEAFNINDRVIVTNIGKNFQFKALFLHEDTVPENNKLCEDSTNLCPRCRMFGMTDTSDKEDNPLGLKGRFKSSALINQTLIKEDSYSHIYPFSENNRPVPLKRWIDQNNNEIAKQVLLPIMGSPKPNKRDVNGYFDQKSGEIKGAKYYLHGKLNSPENIDGVDNKPLPKKDVKNDSEYSHSLRNYAQVCKSEVEFTGTVGAENCTLDEIAAFIVLLDSSIAGNGFKIGLGKAYGLGSIESKINKVWIRKKEDYTWDQKNFSPEEIESSINGIREKVNAFIERIVNRIDLDERPALRFPPKGNYYWGNFWQNND